MNSKDLVHQLDSEVGALLLRSTVMSDISEELNHLQIDMDETKPELAIYYYYEWQRKVRMLSQLMHYASQDLEMSYENIHSIKEDLFHRFVKEVSHEQ
ncbi:hypothetical protein ABRT01_03640 [Lentibacillus sp. L22]